MRMQFALLVLVVGSLVGVEVTAEGDVEPTLTIASISPPAGAIINRSTVLKVVLKYTLDEPTPTAAYYVHPSFNSTSGLSFSALNRVSDGLALKKASGTVEYSYPIAKEWADSKLAKPVVVTFSLLKQVSANSADQIAETEPVSYQVSK
jgi:hypothetical protein